jgi:2'-5' RNA ligase
MRRKLNIHLMVPDVALQYCLQVNKGIRDITDSVIVFDETSPMIPHVSVLMGELDENNSLEEVAELTQDALSSVAPIKFYVHPPYLENVRNRYVFSDVEGGQPFMELKRRLFSLLGERYLQSQSDYTEQPHLTLGHVEDKRNEVRIYLNTIQAGFTFVSDTVEISDAGPKGTCINSLYRHVLRH